MVLRKLTCLSLLVQVSFLSYAQQDTLVITPESKLIDGTIIQPYTNKWKVTVVTADGKEIPNKIWTDYGQVIELKGKKYFHRVQDLYSPNMELIDTWINMVECETLIPISFSTLNPKGGFSYYQFDGNQIAVNSNLNEDRKTTEVNLELAAPIYDWNLYGMLLVGLPFEKGLVAKIPYCDGKSNDIKWVVTIIKGKEELKMPDGKTVTAWKVATTSKQKLNFWLSKSPPYVLKLDLELQNNARLIWEMI